MIGRELIVEAMEAAERDGREWLKRGEIVREVQALHPETNTGSTSADVSVYCINDPSKKHYPGLPYRKNPFLVTDDPTMHGKRYRLLTHGERDAFLAHPRDDLELVSYAQLIDWLRNPQTDLVIDDFDEEPAAGTDSEDVDGISGVALLEIHLQDYLFRNWDKVFPDLRLYDGTAGREYVTSDPNVGTLDFLCTDSEGNFVVIETKRDVPDRQAVGQILGYMGWVEQKLCPDDRAVRGLLIAGDASDRLRMAVSAVPNLDLRIYEITFDLRAP